MKLSNRTKISLLWIGDIFTLYIALIGALLLRYGDGFYDEFINDHAIPFSIVFALWLLVFYVAGLYDLHRLRNNLEFIKTLALSIFVNALLTIAIFYLVPYFGIAPKTNLFIFIALFVGFETWWRRTFNIRASFREGLNRVLLIGDGARFKEISDTLFKDPQLGYTVSLWLKEGLNDPSFKSLHSLVRENKITMIVVPRHAKNNEKFAKTFYEILAAGTEVRDFPSFYELVFRKIPLSDLDDPWFVENHIGQRKFYDDLKRGLEFITGIFLIILLSPIITLTALFVVTTSKGSVIYRQVRVGKNEKTFTLYKFRTMREDAEKDGARWAEKNDKRLTPVGRFLRYTHLDELPQFVNIIRGDISFVGPRPERPEFTEKLDTEISYYRARHLVKPGVTGWAQINYRYGASIEDARQKLEYDIYYLKNRSLIIDLAIIIKTLKTLFVTPS